MREASEAEEKDGRVKDDLCAARCKLVSLEDGAAVAAREAEQRIQSLGSEMQVKYCILSGGAWKFRTSIFLPWTSISFLAEILESLCALFFASCWHHFLRLAQLISLVVFS